MKSLIRAREWPMMINSQIPLLSLSQRERGLQMMSQQSLLNLRYTPRMKEISRNLKGRARNLRNRKREINQRKVLRVLKYHQSEPRKRRRKHRKNLSSRWRIITLMILIRR